MTISLPDDVAKKLQERATRNGTTATAYTAQLVSETINKPTIDELLAPVRADFAKTGMTEDELMNFGREALKKVREEKKAEPA